MSHADVLGSHRDSLLDSRMRPPMNANATRTEARADATVVELVIAAQHGDQTAFSQLYNRFHRVVHAIVLARVSARDANDIVQDTFGDAWAKLRSIRDPAAFPGWLLTMARNRAIDHARKQRPISEIDDLAIDPPPHVEAAAALRALRELPDTYCETMMMRLVEGLSGPEIAARTGMTPESVRVHLHRGMKLLRERLGGSR
jgi:RNA polymerase sigma-70 factor (ECF subfamily)